MFLIWHRMSDFGIEGLYNGLGLRILGVRAIGFRV